MKVAINETTLTAIGDAIREKTGKTDLIAPGAMADEIKAISGGGGDIEVEPIELTGNQAKAFATPIPQAYFNLFADTISTNNITDASSMFSGFTTVEEIPFDINLSAGDCATIFDACYALKTVPAIYNAKPYSLSYMFRRCYQLREIPEDWVDTWDFGKIASTTSSYGAGASSIFEYCYSLRKFPMDLLRTVNENCKTYAIYDHLFYDCFALDEIIGLPVHYRTGLTSNILYRLLSCRRLKHFTFETNEDGSPIKAAWGSQSLSLNGIGYWSTPSFNGLLEYNSGLTTDKEVVDEATYQALKDDPDWWTLKREYSRYNHNSAVETLNSLPDTSDYYTSNTITFLGTEGSATDGGAINTLTEEEIAVAATKGWTVAFV